MPDYYKILGVSKTASDDDIKSAFRELAKKYHPDKNSSKEAEIKFREASEAYDVLGDTSKRQQYDNGGMNPFGGGHPFGGQHPFESFFRGGKGGPFNFSFRTGGSTVNFDDIFSFNMGMNNERHSPRKTKGQDLNIHLNITLDECYLGTNKQIKLKHTVSCGSCSGVGSLKVTPCRKCSGTGVLTTGFLATICGDCQGKGNTGVGACPACTGKGFSEEITQLNIDIPVGVGEGNNLRLQGQGNAGNFGGPPGDLFVFVHEIPHDTIKRNGSDLQIEINITMSEAVLGTKRTIHLLGDELFNYQVEEGTQSGSVEEIKGKGMPIPNSKKRGSLYITRRVNTPINLSSDVKALFEKLREMEQSNENKENNKNQ